MNRIFALRHGHSIPNSNGIVISKLSNGVNTEHGLTEMGCKQAHEAGLKLRQLIGNAETFVCYHSPFSRTTQTAMRALCSADINKSLMIASEALRERDFGSSNEGQSSDIVYERVWENDRLSVDSRSDDDGESLYEVHERCLAFIKELQENHSSQGMTILLVSHGDTLSILESCFRGLDIKAHRDLAYGTGELRQLQ